MILTLNTIRKHRCKSCWQMHDLFSQTFKDGTRHHIYVCSMTNRRYYVPRIEGATFPELPTKKQAKAAKFMKLAASVAQLTARLEDLPAHPDTGKPAPGGW